MSSPTCMPIHSAMTGQCSLSDHGSLLAILKTWLRAIGASAARWMARHEIRIGGLEDVAAYTLGSTAACDVTQRSS